MKLRRPILYRLAVGAVLLSAFNLQHFFAAGEKSSPVRELRVQKVGNTTYFHVRLESPKGSLDWNRVQQSSRDGESVDLTKLPRLVPQDGQARTVYCRLATPERPNRFGPRNLPEDDLPPPPEVIKEKEPEVKDKDKDKGKVVPPNTEKIGEPKRAEQPRRPVPVEGLEFVGRVEGEGKVQFVLIYPRAKDDSKEQPKRLKDRLKKVLKKAGDDWAEMPIELDFGKATKVEIPKEAAKRKPDQPPVRNDLEGLWASAQAADFAIRSNQAPEFGFYSFAHTATGRKYGVEAPPIFAFNSFGPSREWRGGRGPGIFRPGQFANDELYEMTTGAAAITESLALHRMLNSGVHDNGKRTVDVSKIQGIDIEEHPWKKMMGENKPSPDPLAKMIPADNYYVRFKSIRKFLEFGNLMELWGANLSRAFEFTSRDYGIHARYEKQLCLKSTWLGKTFGPAVIRSVAITGNDPYLKEGSDVTIVFDVINKDLFLTAVDEFIKDARKEYGVRLKEGKEDHNGTNVESFVTPLREVSLHRATLDNYVIYSNSPVGVRRVLDTQKGKTKALADALDFQYMRTIFRSESKDEDGFAFLSDAFIRQLVGPKNKIKEKRRLEALTSLSMETNAALFTAWETGSFPKEQKTLLASASLQPEMLFMPEGKEVAWDSQQQVAVSNVYNTIEFATPLVELPIDKVTPLEEQDYTRFRLQYLGLWRQYFDPVGMRLSLQDEQIKMETYILPLIKNTSYNELRRVTGNGTAKLYPNRISPKTLMQFQTHISNDFEERNRMWDAASILGGKVRPFDFLGDWFVFRLDESPALDKLLEMSKRYYLDEEGAEPINEKEATRTFFQIPLIVGVSIRNPLTLAPALAAIRTAVLTSLPGGVIWEAMDPYKDVQIVQIKAKPNSEVLRQFNDPDDKNPFTPAIYYALIDGGLYLSVSDLALRDLIDRAVESRDGKGKTEAVDINSSFYVAPGAASDKLKDFARFYVEKESHQRALDNLSIWYVLYHGGVLAPDAKEDQQKAMARKLFGFVPVSPEGSPYRYEAKTDEVINERHGSLQKPIKHAGAEADSPLSSLLEHFRSIRADLRFREDGIHTTLTIARKKADK